MDGHRAGVSIELVPSQFRLGSVSLLAGLALLWPLSDFDLASALTLEQARENCRETVGRPIVQACMRAGGNLEACRVKARPTVRACVERAFNAVHGRPSAPLAVPSEAMSREPSEGDTPEANTPRTSFVAPPRTIADITAILDQQKPDPEVAAKMRAQADRPPPANANALDLAHFYYDRGQSRSLLGHYQAAIADAEKALEVATGRVDPGEMARLRQFQGLQYAYMGNPKKSLDIFLTMAREVDRPGVKGWLFNTYRWIGWNLIQLGDLDRAVGYLRKAQALMGEARSWPAFAMYGSSWQADVEETTAYLHAAKGRYSDAEAAFRRAETFKRVWLVNSPKVPAKVPPPPQIQLNIDTLITSQGRMKARQGRVAEAEADVRRALLNQLKVAGKYTNGTALQIRGLIDVVVEQGRYAEAEKLLHTYVEIFRAIGFAEDSVQITYGLGKLAGVLNLQRRFEDAALAYEELDKATENWESARSDPANRGTGYIATLYNTNRLQDGIAIAERLLARQKSRLGDQHVETALTRGWLAIGFARSRRDTEAMSAFKTAVPILISAPRATDEDNAIEKAARDQRRDVVIESYMTLLARTGAADAPTESFRLAETLRSRSVQNALAASSARAVAKNPALAELVRKSQDLDKQVNAQLGLLNNLLALPPEDRDDKALKDLQADIAKLRTARDAAKHDIAAKFSNYANLIEPTPPSVDAIRAILKDDEAFVSFYFGQRTGFVWAVPKQGPIAFTALPINARAIEKTIFKLREALEPNAATLDKIPAFDVTLAHELYSSLLEPVEAGWQKAKSLIVVANGALGLLPLGLMPIAPTLVEQNVKPLFAGYRKVPWLARTHAVTLVPSAAALKTLREIPPASGSREPMIGFGDPVFSRAQLTEAEQQASDPPLQVAELTTRGFPLRRRASPQLDNFDSADLALLPRLPDTAEELTSIALALEVDPAKVLKLGIKANETSVKSTDLSRYKIIVFATHGLVPGQLNGLTQPALALSAPEVAGVEGDGLLTMEEILALKLNADWVVFSACNTGTGAGAGAEAASGLGRAFFYAGTRAILVTNWSVDSDAARELTTDLFRRQAADGALTRAEALRQSMLALIDGDGFKDERGRILFSYAHPLFWAPYSIIGDGRSASDR